ncbi:hypothetical protein [Amycolatopsis sp. NPDC004169]|uniref:hypothetical protein n=1 Tax=Amycolatopsis sp. NPDC004169 TaxID=3154453 RepID=UPI0033A3A599
MTANPTTSRIATGVRLRLPESWLEIDPRVTDLSGEIVRTLTEHGAGTAGTGAVAQALVPLVTELRRLTAHTDVLLAGFHTDFADDGSDVVPVFTANVTIALSPPIQDGVHARAEIEREASAEGLESGVHALSGGPALTTWGRVQPARGGTEVFARRFHVPVPGLDQVAVLAFATPNVDFAAEFDELFLSIADTFRFVG